MNRLAYYYKPGIVHSRKGYSYTNKGFLPKQVSPIKTNTLDIINDQDNRDRSSTFRFDNNKHRN
ncbi:hypothetical protein A4H97_33990 [Niastella yeongjuensis]|uniref:Uncharacterized protein n=1 Tax=Niastella yeongjuensis TaxID=354355 RepID=A0A1V9EBB8_9BACT|nr:hypothetical protein A4H97_33990 [Niastella yeongjuensis]